MIDALTFLQKQTAIKNAADVNKFEQKPLKCNNGNNFSVSSESVTAYDWQVNNSSLRGRRRTYLTILKRAWSADFKMVR
jgi:hypothetical protein